MADPRIPLRSSPCAIATELERGLSARDAAQRLADCGRNELRATPHMRRWQRFLGQFRDPLIYLLLAAVAISLIAWVIEPEGWPVDAIVIALIIVLNALLGFVQESKAEDAVAALARMRASRRPLPCVCWRLPLRAKVRPSARIRRRWRNPSRSAIGRTWSSRAPRSCREPVGPSSLRPARRPRWARSRRCSGPRRRRRLRCSAKSPPSGACSASRS